MGCISSILKRQVLENVFNYFGCMFLINTFTFFLLTYCESGTVFQAFDSRFQKSHIPGKIFVWLIFGST